MFLSQASEDGKDSPQDQLSRMVQSNSLQNLQPLLFDQMSFNYSFLFRFKTAIDHLH